MSSGALLAQEARALSSLQRSMVLSSLRAPRSGLYVLQAAFDFPDALDIGLLRTAWRKVAERHAALQTRIGISSDGEIRQRIEPDAEVEWAEIDWSAIKPEEWSARLEAFLKSERERGFDFTAGVPMRIAVLRKPGGAHCLVWSGHHALLDGRSYPVLWGDLFRCYERREDRSLENVPSPPRGADDRVLSSAISRAFEEADDINRSSAPRSQSVTEPRAQASDSAAERYWREYLADAPPTTAFIVDRLRPALGRDQEQDFGEARGVLSEEVTAELWRFAELHGITVNTLVLGAWTLLLSRYSGRSDVVFGVTRTLRSSECHALGLFINTVPFRARVQAGMPAAEWLRSVRQTWLAGREFAHTPLESIHAWSGMPAGTPMFDSVVVYDNEPLTESVRKLGGLAGYCRAYGVQRADVPITVVAYGRPRLSVTIWYDARLFSRFVMDGVAGHVTTLLGSLAAEPMQAKTPAPQKPFASDLCVHRLFERQARRTPQKAALEYPGGIILYSELNERANRLARALRAKGAGPEDFIAVRMERSPDAVVAFLAVLKCGAAFLPIDPALPEERIASMLEDARPRLTLEDVAPAHGEPSGDLPDIAGPENAAYLVYTSGSSGKPKGVVVTHRSIVNHTLAAIRVFGINENDRRLQFAPVGSDVYIGELLNYLSSGATIVFCPGRHSAQEFTRLLDEHRITITAFTGSWWSEWVASLVSSGSAVPGSLRALCVGMEQTQPGALMKWRGIAAGRVRWFNAYGPSEACPTSTIYEAGSSEYECAAFVPIGKPIANTQAYVLDAELNPVPAGIAGELYIGGEGVARGYIGAPEMTSARFLADPFRPGGRMYRTGDLAFRLPDGNLVFLGRLDRQAKIRGFRVELEEIEAVLAKHPSVVQCAVVADGAPGEERLIAYVTRCEVGTVDDLRAHLARRLPAHMIPAAYVMLDRMPLNSSGKIDRQALPAYRPEQPEAVVSDQPRTETERRLAVLWREALGISRAAATDNFFECGGDSLRATRLLTLVQRDFGREVSMSALFRAPTLARLAALIDEGGAAARPMAVNTAGSQVPIFFISASEDDDWRFSGLAARLGQSRPFFGLANPLRGGESLTVEETAARVCRSVREAKPRGPYILGGYCFGGVVAFEAARQLTAAGEDVRLIVLIDSVAPGYPKLLRSGGRYWREMPRVLSGAFRFREIAEHIGFAGRLARRQTISPPDDPRARAAAAYVLKPAAVPAIQFLAGDDRVRSRVLDDPRLGWRDVCPAGFEARRIAGSHATLFLERSSAELASALGEILAAQGC